MIQTPLVSRSEFPLLVAHPELAYLDSAATSQKPSAVLAAIADYYTHTNANPHRGAYALSAAATEAYHAARETVARFLGVADAETVLFTRGATESLNLLAYAWGRHRVSAGDNIVVTRMEHHANFVPWQQLALASGAEFRIVELGEDGALDLAQFATRVDARTKVVAFGHVSNALGTIHPVTEIVRIARTAGDALVVCDGAQAVPHLELAVDALGVDAYTFSGHKVGGPMGIGALVVRRPLLEQMSPWHFGGDMIEWVGDQESTWNALPHKFEAGTPNVEGAVGLAAALHWFEGIGRARVREHEVMLTRYALETMRATEGIRCFGSATAEGRSGVVSFAVDGVHPHDVATMLDAEGICVRAGHHCAQPLMRALAVPATVRASFWVYSTAAEVDRLVDAVTAARKRFSS